MLRSPLVLLAAGLTILGCIDRGPARDAPNVVLVVVDTLRADHLGAYGYPAATSPNLDSLARSSAVFERAIAASARTAPAHASLMTSRWVREHSIGFRNGSTRLEGDTALAEVFRDAGYETAAFIGNSVIRRHVGLDRGFDLYDDQLPEHERNRPAIFERTAAGTAERALAWLERPRTGPFFLWVHFQDPHGPYTPPAPWEEGIEAPEVEGEKPLRPLRNQSGKRGLPAYQQLPGDRTPRRYRSLYAGEIRHFDHWLGRLMEAIESSPDGREVVWVVTADHGESLGEDDIWFAHGHATTPNLAHVPLLIRAPGVVPGRIDELAHHVDVMPTLLSLAGLAAPGEMRGVDLSARVLGGARLPNRVVFSDVGADTSAYSQDGFLRVSQRRGITRPGRGRLIPYRWSQDGVPLRNPGGAGIGWEPDPGGEATGPAARAALERYLALVPPMVEAEKPDDAQLERLRALGYVDPAD